jgi:hypothetical protein
MQFGLLVVIVSGYDLEGRTSFLGRGNRLCSPLHCVQTDYVTHSPIPWIPLGFLLGVERQGLEADKSPSGVGAKDNGNISPVLMVWCDTFTLQANLVVMSVVNIRCTLTPDFPQGLGRPYYGFASRVVSQERNPLEYRVAVECTKTGLSRFLVTAYLRTLY